jgi:hypothetical protein
VNSARSIILILSQHKVLVFQTFCAIEPIEHYRMVCVRVCGGGGGGTHKVDCVRCRLWLLELTTAKRGRGLERWMLLAIATRSRSSSSSHHGRHGSLCGFADLWPRVDGEREKRSVSTQQTQTHTRTCANKGRNRHAHVREHLVMISKWICENLRGGEEVVIVKHVHPPNNH